MTINLVPPSSRYRDSFLRARDEFQHEGLAWWFGAGIDAAAQDFQAFVDQKLNDSCPRMSGRVPKTHRWAVMQQKFVGRIAIHHELSDALRISGGHIGYDTVPSFRGRGVATQMLRQALPLARALGLAEVLLTSDDHNLASHRVIERNGGVLRETKRPNPARPAKRYYWISLV